MHSVKICADRRQHTICRRSTKADRSEGEGLGVGEVEADVGDDELTGIAEIK